MTDEVRRGKPQRVYTINPDKLQDFIESIDTDALTDPQKCGHILTFFQQQGVIKTVALNPADMYIRDKNAAPSSTGSSINLSGVQRRNG